MSPLAVALAVVILAWAALSAGDRPAPTVFLTAASLLLVGGTIALSV